MTQGIQSTIGILVMIILLATTVYSGDRINQKIRPRDPISN